MVSEYQPPFHCHLNLFRFAFLGKGNINAFQFFYSTGFMVIIVCFGFVLFNKMSDRLMDVI